MRVRRYSPEDKQNWNDFVAKSKNATFMLNRNFMDYHSDRFVDHSLVISDAQRKIVALLPASERDDVYFSHQGLTYAGFLVDFRMTLPLMVQVFDSVLQYLNERGFKRLVYKTIPTIYHTIPAEEDRYGLFLRNAKLYRRDTLTVIDYSRRLGFQERRLRSIKKALKRGLKVVETDAYAQFWEILSNNLHSRHKVAPVHSLSEIKLLAGRFRKNIKLFASLEDEVMHAGAVVFDSRNVCHVQYNAASEEGKRCGALDIVLDHLIERYSSSRNYFDFGVSNEDEGRYLNTGLTEYKEGFGGRTVVHDFYDMNLAGTTKD